ncbi:hypothetical protein AGMMS49982_08670 [Bacteroidia bacterium]|nr:hypothetical protein AGMMS49982_08670 [Bacteroidia bacterium]
MKKKKENYWKKICAETGKWVVDVAKYVATAVIITSSFVEMSTELKLFYGCIATAVMLIVGMCLLIMGKEDK